jgi:hypothetical protein
MRAKDVAGGGAIDSKVMLLTTEERGFKLAVELDVTLPSIADRERHPRQHRRRAHGQRPRGELARAPLCRSRRCIPSGNM